MTRRVIAGCFRNFAIAAPERSAFPPRVDTQSWTCRERPMASRRTSRYRAKSFCANENRRPSRLTPPGAVSETATFRCE